MRFAYLKDPLFLVTVAAYLLNRLLLKRIWPAGFVHDHVNDLLCVPLVTPMIAWAAARLRVRGHDGPPCWHEVLIPIIVISIVFEIALPLAPIGARPAVPDPLDVLCYLAGGLAAAVWWRWWYRWPSGAMDDDGPNAGFEPRSELRKTATVSQTHADPHRRTAGAPAAGAAPHRPDDRIPGAHHPTSPAASGPGAAGLRPSSSGSQTSSSSS